MFNTVIILLFFKYVKKLPLLKIYSKDRSVKGDGNNSGGYLTICSVLIKDVDIIQRNGSIKIVPKTIHTKNQATFLLFFNINS